MGKKKGGKPPRHKAMKSTKEAKKAQMAREADGLPNEGKNWAVVDVDTLFDMYLAGKGWKEICFALGRSQSACETMIWKVLIKYNSVAYIPGHREDREHKSWTENEIGVLTRAMEQDWSPRGIAVLLSRSVGAVERKMESYKGGDRPTLFDLSGEKPVPNPVVNDGSEIQSQAAHDSDLAAVKEKPITEHEGKKYLRMIKPAHVGHDCSDKPIYVDVYAVLQAFGVTCPGRQQAIKKLLCAGLRGKGSQVDDLLGALAALNRAVELQRERESPTSPFVD